MVAQRMVNPAAPMAQDHATLRWAVQQTMMDWELQKREFKNSTDVWGFCKAAIRVRNGFTISAMGSLMGGSLGALLAAALIVAPL